MTFFGNGGHFAVRGTGINLNGPNPSGGVVGWIGFYTSTGIFTGQIDQINFSFDELGSPRIGLAVEKIFVGADTFIGGPHDDEFNGYSGDDVTSGGAGNDSFLHSAGLDRIDGGDGFDQVAYYSVTQPVVVFLAEGADAVLTVGGVTEDIIRNVERVSGGSAGDTFVGDAGANTLDGWTGNDWLFGNGFGPDGTMNVGAGIDVLAGGQGDDGLFGGNGNDLLYGGSGNDGVVGGSGDDLMTGGAGTDYLFGGAFSISDGSRLSGSGKDNISGGADNDAIYGFDDDDLINGDGDHDYVEGGVGNDVINGGAGNDFVLGQHGDDSISGGAGWDYEYGGAGADTFIFRDGDSYDWILDFNASEGDKLKLEGFSYSNFTDIPLVDRSTPGNPAVQLVDSVGDIGDGLDELTIFGVTLAQLNATNVLLA